MNVGCKNMSKLFKYDVVILIELVEGRPCLWDKTADCFKDKVEKQKAWKEICAFLEDSYNEMDTKEQHKIGLAVAGKWQNIRDSFIKSLKKQSGQATTKKYLYHNQLLFLMKIIQKDDTVSSLEDSPLSLDPNEEEQEVLPEVVQSQKKSTSKCMEVTSSRKKARMQQDVDRQILQALTNNTGPDEDEAFFISITPAVRRMSQDEKLEFRMSVLQLIKDINNRKENQPLLEPFSPASSSSTTRTPTPFTITNTSMETSGFSQLLPCEQSQFSLHKMLFSFLLIK